MPVDLHERLSEFSYGYGVTREVEDLFRSVGLTVTPFLPSLIHEAELGFDVGFNRPGRPLILQFKLGQAMQRFRPAPRPALGAPFWRYTIDTAEPDGQFELLLKAEQDGAEVLYVAPRFHDWDAYLYHFESQQVLGHSLLAQPSSIRAALVRGGQPDGLHRIVYDRHSAYVCSEPEPLKATNPDQLAEAVVDEIRARDETLGQSLRRIYMGFGDRSAIRRKPEQVKRDMIDRAAYAVPSYEGRQPQLRARRLERLRERTKSEEDALALAVASEAWAAGAQMIMLTDEP